MPRSKNDIVLPTPEEDAAIRAGIDSDPDTRELDAEQMARMRPASEVVPHVVDTAARGASREPP